MIPDEGVPRGQAPGDRWGRRDEQRMTSRQRVLDAFHFEHPDRIPVVYHASPAGLHVHGERLLDLFRAYPPDNPVAFDGVPGPEIGTVDGEGRYHELRTDEWGTTWEHLIFGIHGHPRQYPFADWEAGQAYPFPPVPEAGSPEFEADQAQIDTERRDFLAFRGWISLFEKLHALRPFEEVLTDLGAGEPKLTAFLDRLEAYWAGVVDHWLALGADVITFGDDWGTQTAQLVSTDLFRRTFKPRYRSLMDRVRSKGRKVFCHSCGHLGEIFDELLDLGIDGFWPQITRYDDETFRHVCKANRVAVYIHPDRQRLVPLGTPGEIADAIRIYAETYRALGGGGIFYVEIENDAPFENVKTLIESIHQYR